MPRKTILATGLLAAVGGGFLVCVSASAQVPTSDGYRDSGTHTRTSYSRYNHRNRNAIANSSEGFNRIRLPINSTNNLAPVAISSPGVNP
jgi:hypothetical protein